MNLKKIRKIVTLASYPPRIKYVSEVIKILKKQTLKPDKIILYLAKEEFPKGIAELPKKLQEEIKKETLEVRFVSLNLKSHNKYFYALQEFPNDLVITVDDDIRLPFTSLEELYKCWLDNKSAVIARRAHLITFGNEGVFDPYNSWIHEFDLFKGVPSMQVMATGCGGILYPPNCFPASTFDPKTIISTSLFADDIWLKVQELINNIPVVVSSKAQKLSFIGDSQDYGLIEQNGKQQMNDYYWKKVIEYADKKYNKSNFVYTLLVEPRVGKNILEYNNLFEVIRTLNIKEKKLERKLNKKITLILLKFAASISKLPNKLKKKFIDDSEYTC